MTKAKGVSPTEKAGNDHRYRRQSDRSTKLRCGEVKTGNERRRQDYHPEE